MLACVLLGLFPLTAKAQPLQQTQKAAIQEAVAENYRKALQQAGRRTFKGFCGACVSNQLQALGIIEGLKGCDGKDQYNRYRAKQYTDRGYPVLSYGASAFTLESALNSITANGTRNVYNLLVGFESTNSEAGKKYGHALVIYAIIDGMVYFAECMEMYIGGQYYPEGAGICCSIRDFVDHYNSGCVFDGINWFGNNSCAEQCTNYPMELTGMIQEDTPAYSDVGFSKTHGQPRVIGTVPAGQLLNVLSIIQAPDGSYWYQVWWDGRECYIRPGMLKEWAVGRPVPTVNVGLVSSFKQGKWFRLRGTVSADTGMVTWLQVAVYNREDHSLVFSGETEVSGGVADVAAGPIWNKLNFWKLPVGEYELVISGQVESYRMEGDQLTTAKETGELWRGHFRVTEEAITYPLVTLDAQGGSCALQQLAADPSQPLGELPAPEKDGYRFLGWFTEPEGGEQVTEDAMISAHTTLYAHWAAKSFTGWKETDNGWIYHRDSQIVSGWFYSDHIRFWQGADGTYVPGWLETEEGRFYLTGSGAMHTGWLSTEEGKYFLGTDGHCITGWATIRGKRYCFESDGRAKEGWFYTGSGICYLSADWGQLTGLRQIGDRQYLFDADGTLLMAMPDARILLPGNLWAH